MKRASAGKTAIFAAAAVVCAASSASRGDAITAAPSGSTVIDFSQFNDVEYTTGPKQVGGLVGRDVTWSSTYSDSVIGNGAYAVGGTSGNGIWDPGRNGYVGTNSESTGVAMTFSFNDGPVSAVAGFVNYAPGAGDFVIKALDSMGNVLETFNVGATAPIVTPDGLNQGAFRGISRDQADIFKVVFAGAFGVVDDLSFTASANPASTPLPAAAPAGLALIGAMGLKRNRRKGTA